MRHILKTAGLAALLALGTGASTSPAAAQLNIQIGPDRPRVIERRIYRDDDDVVVRRVRPVRRTVCRTTGWRTVISPRGIRIREPVRRCTITYVR